MQSISPETIFRGNDAWEKALPQITKLTKNPLVLGRSIYTNDLRNKILKDLKSNFVDIVTIGQYLSPGPNHLPVQRFVSPSKFNFYKVFGEKDLDFMQVVSSPLTRSSYHAEEIQKLMKKYPR